MKKHKTTTQYEHPGRPAYKPKFPAKLRWTMTDFQIRNGVNPDTGKGENCSKLTLVKFLARDLRNRRSGLIVKLKDETANPSSDSGLGRKAFLYSLRSRLSELDTKPAPKAAKPAKKLATASKSNVSVKLNQPTYEATKAALGLDVPASTTTTAPATAPVTEPAAPAATEPLAEVPATAGTVAA